MALLCVGRDDPGAPAALHCGAGVGAAFGRPSGLVPRCGRPQAAPTKSAVVCGRCESYPPTAAQLPLNGGAVRRSRTEGVDGTEERSLLCHSERPHFVILSGAKNPHPPSFCVTGTLPQSPSVTAPSEREPRTRVTDSSALRPQNDGERCMALFCVGRDVVLAKSAPLRPHKFRISRPALAGRSRSLHCSSFPHKAGQPCGVPLAGGHFSLRSLARPLPSPSQAAHPSSCRKRQASSAPLLRLSQRKAFRLPLGPPFRYAGLAWGP